ncbi:hypothetical protein JXB28_05890 [Candidatus Woesearchaeota archaeon]|nr:hypothetical protein [Candidatus Woesearchaeota archaeon]
MAIDEENLSPEEKIKQLLGSEKEKREELEAKKAELDKKKKELEELEKKSTREIQATRKAIQEQIEEIASEEKQRFEELEEIRRKRELEAQSLEEAITEEEEKGNIPQGPVPRGYGDAINQVLAGNPTFYDITNYNVMNQLEQIASQAANRAMTEQERAFVELVQYHAERFGRDDFYKDKDESNYLARELAKVDQISKSAKDSSQMKKLYDV